jgi:hypothetical protein
MITQKAIQDFKDLYNKRFGIELSDEEALRKAFCLLSLYMTIHSKEKINETGKSGRNA